MAALLAALWRSLGRAGLVLLCLPVLCWVTSQATQGFRPEPLQGDAAPVWLDLLSAQKDGNKTRSCGPSLCFSAGSRDCFTKHPAAICMKAIYFCVEYVISGPNAPQVCQTQDEEPSWNQLAASGNDASYFHQMRLRFLPQEHEGQVVLSHLLLPISICLVLGSFVLGARRLFYMCCMRPALPPSGFQDPLLKEEFRHEFQGNNDAIPTVTIV
mmetsp:Transcript_10321/g.11332  ORF Transcript_10321/g.11332 Transcript_10321/m.11332 type:complete len:213 (-) Transcript_10321:171-809(-)